MNRNTKGALLYCKNIISDLLQNKIDLSLLIISKSISKKSDDGDDEGSYGHEEKKADKTKKDDKFYQSKQAHVELAKKMKKRDGEGITFLSLLIITYII